MERITLMTEQDNTQQANDSQGLPEMEAQPVEEAVPQADPAEEMREKWLRAQAEIQNMRKRAASQTKTSVQRERTEILLAFLGVLDSLEAALSKHEGEHNDWVEGTQAIFQQMIQIFKRYNVEPFSALGDKFDPNLHEAMSQVPMPDHPAGTIVEVLQPGFRFTDGNLLRPARVVVSSGPAE
jgi:molecular chaperone GrpE